MTRIAITVLRNSAVSRLTTHAARPSGDSSIHDLNLRAAKAIEDARECTLTLCASRVEARALADQLSRSVRGLQWFESTVAGTSKVSAERSLLWTTLLDPWPARR